jgi:predicted GTPase
MADVIVVNKVDAATPDQVRTAETSARAVNPSAPIVHAASPVRLADPEAVRGKRVIVVEDGPTTTHGGMPTGAGYTAARAAGAAAIVDPRAAATPGIREVYERYPHLGPVLPAVGYGADQIAELEATIQATDADVVVAGTPIDLAAVVRVTKPVVRARYEYEEVGDAGLSSHVDAFLDALPGPA